MTATRIIALLSMILGSGLALQLASAQQQGVKRTELQRRDLSVAGRGSDPGSCRSRAGSDVPETLASR